jgi:hypothetical protein
MPLALTHRTGMSATRRHRLCCGDGQAKGSDTISEQFHAAPDDSGQHEDHSVFS